MTSEARTIAVLCSSAQALAGRDGSQRECGVWAEELVAAWKVFLSLGYSVVIATPDGASATVEPASIAPESCLMSEDELSGMVAFLESRRPELESPAVLREVLEDRNFDGVYIPGGYGPTAQFRSDTTVGTLVDRCVRQGIPIAAVCHGVSALLAADTAGIVDRKVTSFTNAEEQSAGADSWVPYLLESELSSKGLDHVAAAPWSCHVLEDGNLITGQNPASSAEAARRLGVRIEYVSGPS